jgi:hypothetical protein
MNVRLIMLMPVVLLLTGCGTGPGRLVGCVTFKGAALPSGSVTVHAADGNTYSTTLAADGSFRIDGVPPGPARITVQSHPHTPPGLLGKDRYTPKGKAAAQFVAIPDRYGRPDQSGLTCQVKGGEQTCTLDLTP